jgi:multidrug transporter EmrE-like cation transporter
MELSSPNAWFWYRKLLVVWLCVVTVSYSLQPIVSSEKNNTLIVLMCSAALSMSFLFRLVVVKRRQFKKDIPIWMKTDNSVTMISKLREGTVHTDGYMVFGLGAMLAFMLMNVAWATIHHWSAWPILTASAVLGTVFVRMTLKEMSRNSHLMRGENFRIDICKSE